MYISSSNNFVTLFSSIKKKLYKILNERIKEYNVSITEAIYLIIVREKRDGISFKELTKIADCDKGMTTKVINSLKEKGYIDSSNDKYYYILTNQGKNISNSIINILEELRKNLVIKFNKEQLIKLYDLLYNFNGVLEGEIKC